MGIPCRMSSGVNGRNYRERLVRRRSRSPGAAGALGYHLAASSNHFLDLLGGSLTGSPSARLDHRISLSSAVACYSEATVDEESKKKKERRKGISTDLLHVAVKSWLQIPNLQPVSYSVFSSDKLHCLNLAQIAKKSCTYCVESPFLSAEPGQGRNTLGWNVPCSAEVWPSICSRMMTGLLRSITELHSMVICWLTVR